MTRGTSKKGPQQKKNTQKHHPGCFFFFAPAPPKSRGARAKKKTPPRVFFFCSGAATFRRGRSKKKKTPWVVFFFCCGPARTLTHSLRAWVAMPPPRRGGVFFFAAALPGPGWCFFFALAPCRRPTGLLLPLPFPGAGAKKKTPWVVFFFLLWPRAGTQRGFSFACLSPGPQQKKNTLGGVFFFALAPCRRPTGFLLPLPFAGAAAKKKTPWVVFFFLLRPRADAHSLTAGLGGDASPSPGWCFFFLLRPRPDRGGVFFFCCGPARTLTHSRWAGAISARPGWCFFFLLRPRRVFLDNNKKCLGYYIGSKKTRRGHSKKKNTTSFAGLYELNTGCKKHNAIHKDIEYVYIYII